MFDKGLAHQHFSEVWHKILGHLNVRNMKNFQSLVDGMQVMNGSCDLTCEACVEGNQVRQPFSSDGTKKPPRYWRL